MADLYAPIHHFVVEVVLVALVLRGAFDVFMNVVFAPRHKNRRT